MDFASQLEAADRAVEKHLGGPVTYTSSAGESVTVQGVFDEAYVKVDASNPGVSTTGPAVFLTMADLPSDPTVDSPTITVKTKSYKPYEAKPDGLGGVLLLLHEV